MELGLSDLAMIAGIAGAPMALVALYLRSLRSELQESQSALTKRLDAHDNRIEAINQELAGKADKADWLAAEVSMRNKMDRMAAKLDEIGGQLQSEFGTGAAIRQLARVLEKVAEK